MLRRFLVSIASIGALLAALVGAQPAQAVTNPVLVVGGLTETTRDMQTFLNRLQADGFTAFTMQLPSTFGTPGCGDIADSGEAVATKAAQILSQTGASHLDVVGHSMGGLALRYYIKNLGGTSQVERYVSLGTPQHGTEAANTFTLCLGVVQMRPGSRFLTELNSPTDVPAPVIYTALATIYDTLVTPAPEASFLQDGGTNATIQQFCPDNTVSHTGLITDSATYQLSRSAIRGQALAADCTAP